MGADASRAVYRFDRFVLDLARGALLADGAECALRPKCFALLRCLVENAGRLVGRDEIMQAVWPGVFVTDDSIAQCIREIRRALGDDEQRLLRTLPRRGYLFAAPVARVDTAGVSNLTPTDDLAKAPPRPPTQRPMVVVLPFENIGNDPAQGYFTDGLTADLVTDLTRFQALHIVSPRRRLQQLGRGRPDASWADTEALPPAAAYLVSGSIRGAASHLRVTMQLEDAQSGVAIWAQRFDRPLEDLFTVQQELAEQLAARLVSQVEREGMRMARSRPPASLGAYDLCLRGRELHARATEADTLTARDMFARAIDLDPEYAIAYAWQAYTVQRGFTHAWGEPRGRAAAVLALQFAHRAVEIEPRSSRCLARLALALALNARWEEALRVGHAAVLANPCVVEAREGYGDVLIHAGDPIQAVRELRLALSLDPFYPPALRSTLGRALLLAGRPHEALVELRWCAERLPDYGIGLQTLVVAAVETGHMDEARRAVRELLRLSPTLTTRNISDRWFFRDPDIVERFRVAFRAVGLPADPAGATG